MPWVLRHDGVIDYRNVNYKKVMTLPTLYPFYIYDREIYNIDKKHSSKIIEGS